MQLEATDQGFKGTAGFTDHDQSITSGREDGDNVTHVRDASAQDIRHRETLPARHPDQSRKTLITGDPENGPSAVCGRVLIMSGPKGGGRSIRVGIIDRWGNIACHTGTSTRGWSGHRVGDGFAALGNVLKDEDVVHTMAKTFTAGTEIDLAERIMLALEAGRSAGGQHGNDGPLPERSASLLLHEKDEHPALDLRVDSHPDAVGEMRGLLEEFRPYIPFYRQRWLEPAMAVPQDAFVKDLPSGS